MRDGQKQLNETPASGPTGWGAIARSDRLVLGLTIAIISLLTIRNLPPGICFGDAGELQLASTTLGVMHPPGYTGFVTVGWLISRIPGVDPAFLVSIACHVCGLIALALCMLVQVRLGVNAWIAAALTLSLTAHWRVWANLTTPEVYAPSLAVLLGSVYMLLKYACLGRRCDLLWAALLFGWALSHRPIVIWTFPFLVIGWLAVRRRWDPSWRYTLRNLGLATAVAAVPGVYHFGYLWIRDRETTAYNSIVYRTEEMNDLPLSTAGAGAKWQRIVHHTTARDFDIFKRYDWSFIWRRLRRLYLLFSLNQPIGFGVTLAWLGLGAVVLFHRSPPAGWILTGLILGNIAFLCTYDIEGLACDVTPMISAATVLAGLAVAPWLPLGCTGWREGACVAALVVAVTVTWQDAPQRKGNRHLDAVGFVRETDLATLPAHSVILAEFHQSIPLRYAQQFTARREDIKIVTANPFRWAEQMEKYPDRPIFFASKSSALDGYNLGKFRTLWRLEER